MDTVLNYLKINTWARERHNKDVAILNMLAENPQYLEFMKKLPTSVLTDFVKDYTTLDRYWRKVTEENKELRGKDYDTKAQLEFNTQQNLGYESGFNQNIKKLNKIT